MKNHYEVSADGLTATIFLKRRSGEIIHCRVDSADLPKLQGFNVTWHASWSKYTHSFYARCNDRANGKHMTIWIHRFLMDAPQGLDVDHRNHDTLDNRRENLRVSTRSGNGMNRKGAASHSKTRQRGICHYPSRGKFILQLTINGKRRTVGYFATIDEAIAVRNQFQEYRERKDGNQ
jgi:hypothetical protein